MKELFGDCNKIAIISAGGGGDIVTAALYSIIASRYGLSSVIGGVVWERFIVDITPGPIRLSEIKPLRRESSSLGWITGKSKAYRKGGIVEIQAARIAEYLKLEVLAIDLNAEVMKLTEDLAFFMDKHEVNAMLMIDVGGDILAYGNEGDLWSPLADALMLNVASKLKAKGLNVVLGVHGLGVDGELNPSYLLERLSKVAKDGGYLGARGLFKDDIDYLEKLLSKVVTEASRLPVDAFKGKIGELNVRLGTRRVHLSLLSTITFFVDPRIVKSLSLLAKKIETAKTIHEANELLHEIPVYTELDLEMDVYNKVTEGAKVDGKLLAKLREEGLRKLSQRLNSHYKHYHRS